MLIPRNLKKGDTVGILSTARKINADALQFTVKMLESWGLKVRLGNSIGAESHQFAGSDDLRTQNLQAFLDDDSIDAILCARGGYGTVRIIDELNFDKFIQNPKWICGFSDVTVLHSHLNRLGIASIHSSMPSLFPKTAEHETLLTLKRALMGEKNNWEFPFHLKNINGNATAELVGGNLSLIFALQGSISDLETKNKILFLEDLDEYLYHLDRMMISLDRSGKLKGLKGLIIGGMTAMRDNEIPFGYSVEEIILTYASKYNFPVYFGFPSGHMENNFALKMGCICNVIVKENTIHFQQL